MNISDLNDDELQERLKDLAREREANRAEAKAIGAELDRRNDSQKLDRLLDTLTPSQREELQKKLALTQTIEALPIGAAGAEAPQS